MLERLEESTNLVEIYLTSKQQLPNVVDIKADEQLIANAERHFKNWKTTKYIAYRRNHLTYLYDLTDDNQIVFTKIAVSSRSTQSTHNVHQLLQINYNYSKLPSHLFPCTKDIDDVEEYTISENRLNNRVSLNIKRDQYGAYLYIEYKHSPNVDIEKTESIIQSVVKSI